MTRNKTRTETIYQIALEKFGFDRVFSMRDLNLENVTNPQISQALITLKYNGQLLGVGQKAKGHAQAKYICNPDYVSVKKVLQPKLTIAEINKQSRDRTKDEEKVKEDAGLRIQEWINRGVIAC